MFKNQANGRKNLLGIKMREIRKARGISQRQVADDLAELGLVVDKNAVQRMESGQRFITDIELITISKYLDIPVNELLASLTNEFLLSPTCKRGIFLFILNEKSVQS